MVVRQTERLRTDRNSLFPSVRTLDGGRTTFDPYGDFRFPSILSFQTPRKHQQSLQGNAALQSHVKAWPRRPEKSCWIGEPYAGSLRLPSIRDEDAEHAATQSRLPADRA